MGISFQIRDDVLDLITAREVLGKDKASDLTEGKMTLVMIHGLKHSIRLDPSQLTSEKAIDSAIKDLKDAGSIDYAMEKAAESPSLASRDLPNSRISAAFSIA